MSQCVKHEMKALRDMSAVELEAYVATVEKREQRLIQLEEDLQKKQRHLEEERRKFLVERDQQREAGRREREQMATEARPRSPRSPRALAHATPRSTSKMSMKRLLSSSQGEIQEVNLAALKLFQSGGSSTGDTLRKILANMHARHAFRMFSVADFCEERFLFWEAVEKYRATSEERRDYMAMRTYRKYLLPEAPLYVDVPEDLLIPITAGLSEYLKLGRSSELVPSSGSLPNSLFDACSNHVFDLMCEEQLGRFLQCSLCMEVAQQVFAQSEGEGDASGGKVTRVDPVRRSVDQQRLICRVDRVRRRRFVQAVKDGNFPEALHAFETLRDADCFFLRTGYMKAVHFLLTTCSAPADRELLEAVVARDGHSLHIIAATMSRFTIRSPAPGV
eukprot:CAMPEP_0119148228 /NCGR_PEP_ID=MMETSP1310-20130426/41522_1 /TAXON_ID=464262 /ORGANISM="Genus nov. species nov., Strain RCC2339" /LENGTH=390 /DNA_ID=CAMNT_0007140253 /DNA_START=360 /DNA_END=1528 /DNA_ORIENTATION=-